MNFEILLIFCSIMVFPQYGILNMEHVIVSFFIEFPYIPKGDVPFECTTFLFSC